MGEIKLENEVLRNDVRLLEETIETTGERERILADRIGVLEDDIAKLETHSRKREVFFASDRAELIRKYTLEVSELEEQRRQLHDLADIEMRVKDSIIANIMGENKKLNKLITELETKLKIPRHHFKFLEEHGTLDEFVKAKQEDDGAAARLALEKTLEINRVMKRKTKIMSVDQVEQPMSNNNLKMYLPLSQQSPRVVVGGAKRPRRDVMVKSDLGGAV